MNNMKKLKDFFVISWKISPSYILLLLLQTFASSGQIFINVILPKYLIDELVGNAAPNKLILYGSMIVISNVFFLLLSNTMKYIIDVKNIYMEEKMSQSMSEKIMNV